MSITVCLDRVMAERGVGLCELAGEVGITPVNLSRIKTGRVRSVRFSTLDALCRILGCEPGDILEYEPEDDAADGSTTEAASFA